MTTICEPWVACTLPLACISPRSTSPKYSWCFPQQHAGTKACSLTGGARDYRPRPVLLEVLARAEEGREHRTQEAKRGSDENQPADQGQRIHDGGVHTCRHLLEAGNAHGGSTLHDLLEARHRKKRKKKDSASTKRMGPETKNQERGYVPSLCGFILFPLPASSLPIGFFPSAHDLWPTSPNLSGVECVREVPIHHVSVCVSCVDTFSVGERE